MTESKQSTALSIPVRGMDDIYALGTKLEQSGMFGLTQQGQGAVVVMTCIQEGMSPLQFIETYHIIGGRPSKRADAILADFLAMGGHMKLLKRSPDECRIWLEFHECESDFGLTWDEVQAEPFTRDKSGGFKTNYATPRARMQTMWARLVSDGVRAICPGACRGAYTPEEIADFSDDEPRHVSPQADPVDAAIHVQAEVVEAAPEPTPEPDTETEIDWVSMPFGKAKGTPFADMTIEQLDWCIKTTNPAMTPTHRAAARLAKENKQEEIKG